MPLFEFVCSQCGRPFEELVRSASAVSEVTCPNCGSRQVKKQISVFASKVNGGSSLSSFSSASSCNIGST